MANIKRAIIMAAGMGTRLRPITDSIPKPLIRVNGTPIIETIIDALHKNNIFEIYVVVGYLKEQFDYLTKKYNNLKLINNPFYDVNNNISSLYVARNYICESFIIDGDQIINNSKVFNPIFSSSGYSAKWTEVHTNEWLMKTNENGIVISCNRTGGAKGWQLYGVSRWTKEDGKKLIRYLEIEFDEKKNSSIYWDDLPMFLYRNDFSLKVYKLCENDIIEIDTVEELDKYANYLH